MVDRYDIQRALLIGVVKNKKWEILILNGITEEYFQPANRPLYRYIKDYIEKNKYPELPVISYDFQIDDQTMGEYTSIQDLQGLCNSITKEYIADKLEFSIGKLNEFNNEILTDPITYIQKLGDTYTELKQMGYKSKSVGLFDNIEDVLKIDPSDVISTGFTELDKSLVGWKRGEELVIFMGRTGQGKSWMGLKFALAAALQNENIGIYSGEMSTQQLQERILCCCKQNYTDSKEDALNFINSKNLNIRVLTQSELRRRANINDLEEMIVKDKLTMLVVDQLSLLEDITMKPGTPLRQTYGNISMDLFTLSSKYNLPVILLVQSNRAGSQDPNGPGLENIAESDAVAQNSTRVISMKNESGILTLNILKNRYGESNVTLKYEVDFAINKYKLIREVPQDMAELKRAKAKAMFKSISSNREPF